jgi:hypothetical protein
MSAALVELSTLAGRINKEHALAEEHAKTAVKHARNAGAMLLESKALCEHGTWAAWLESNFKGSDRTAQRYMRISERWPELEAKTTRVSDLSLRGALELLTESKEDTTHTFKAELTKGHEAPPEEQDSERLEVVKVIRGFVKDETLQEGELELIGHRLATFGKEEEALTERLIGLSKELDGQWAKLKIRHAQDNSGRLRVPPGMPREQWERAISETVHFRYRSEREVERWVYSVVSSNPEYRLARMMRESDEINWELGQQGSLFKVREDEEGLKRFYQLTTMSKVEVDARIRTFEVFILQPSLDHAEKDYETYKHHSLVLGSIASSVQQKHPERFDEFASKTDVTPETLRKLARLYDEAAGAQA